MEQQHHESPTRPDTASRTARDTNVADRTERGPLTRVELLEDRRRQYSIGFNAARTYFATHKEWPAPGVVNDLARVEYPDWNGVGTSADPNDTIADLPASRR